jgi:DNA repair protein RecN (Recombination protein N)
MLAELRISNFALIDSLQLEFPPGFLVLTGETGTGKSLLIDALLLLIGGRASSDQIRFGADGALVEARFLIPDGHPVLRDLRENGYLDDGQQDLIVRRMISRAGKNRIYLNGIMAPLQTLQDIGPQLVDIHGQHDQQLLLSPKMQLKLLDAFGNLEDLVGRYQQRYQEWVQTRAELEEFEQKLEETGRQRDLLQFQYDELCKLRLQTGEEAELNEEYHRLKHRGRLGELSNRAFEMLYEEEPSLLERLGVVKQTLHAFGEIDPQGQSWVGLVDSAEAALREVTDGLRDYRQCLDFDPDRMDAIDSRLAVLQRTQKKYGKTIEELQMLVQDLERDLNNLNNSETEVLQRRSVLAKCEAGMKEVAQELSERRQKAGEQLVQRVRQELDALKMTDTEIHVNVVRSGEPEFGINGMDRMEMLIVSNPGEPPLPLGRIASGGELSRIMLALKTVFAGNDHTPVVIFDEIDTGIGGEAGLVMGACLRHLARYHQVCCVTHLSQIAAQAHAHFVVEKTASGTRTVSRIHQVSGEEREVEIARMLGGSQGSPTFRKTAGELLQRAQTGERNASSASRPAKPLRKSVKS